MQNKDINADKTIFTLSEFKQHKMLTMGSLRVT